jgi:hypothetical protein
MNNVSPHLSVDKKAAKLQANSSEPKLPQKLHGETLKLFFSLQRWKHKQLINYKSSTAKRATAAAKGGKVARTSTRKVSGEAKKRVSSGIRIEPRAFLLV